MRQDWLKSQCSVTRGNGGKGTLGEPARLLKVLPALAVPVTASAEILRSQPLTAGRKPVLYLSYVPVLPSSISPSLRPRLVAPSQVGDFVLHRSGDLL